MDETAGSYGDVIVAVFTDYEDDDEKWRLWRRVDDARALGSRPRNVRARACV